MGTIDILSNRIKNLKTEKTYLANDIEHHELATQICHKKISGIDAEIKEIEHDIAVLESFKLENRKEEN